MHRVIRKRIRHTGDGIDLVADVNAEIAINVGRSSVPEPEPDPEPGAAATDPDSPAEPRQHDPEGEQQ